MKKLLIVAVVICAGRIHAFETVNQTVQAFKMLTKEASAQDVEIQVKAALLIQEAFRKFYFVQPTTNESIVASMMKQYYAKYAVSPFDISVEADASRLKSLERENEQLKLAVQQLRTAHASVTQALEQEKIKEGYFKRMLAITLQKVAQAADLKEMKKITPLEALEQWEHAQQNMDALKTQMRESLARQQAELETAKKQYDEAQEQVRQLQQHLSQEHSAYEVVVQEKEGMQAVCERQVSEIRAEYDRQVNALVQEKDDLKTACGKQIATARAECEHDRAADRSAIQSLGSQLEATRSQYAEAKAALSDARRQAKDEKLELQAQLSVERSARFKAHERVVELERQIETERIASEGAVGDERAQRLRLRQQVQELQKKFDTERISYEKKISSLERQVTVLVDRLTHDEVRKHEILEELNTGEFNS